MVMLKSFRVNQEIRKHKEFLDWMNQDKELLTIPHMYMYLLGRYSGMQRSNKPISPEDFFTKCKADKDVREFIEETHTLYKIFLYEVKGIESYEINDETQRWANLMADLGAKG